jgi:hypothetical protein
MSTSGTFIYHYTVGIERVAELIRDSDFLEQRCVSSGEDNVKVTVEPIVDGYRVIIARDAAVELPSFVKRLFRARNRIVDDILWRREGTSWIGEYTIAPSGFPGTIRGRSVISPTLEGCKHESSFLVAVKLPVLGAKLEKFLVDLITKGFADADRRNAEQLERRAS